MVCLDRCSFEPGPTQCCTVPVLRGALCRLEKKGDEREMRESERKGKVGKGEREREGERAYQTDVMTFAQTYYFSYLCKGTDAKAQCFAHIFAVKKVSMGIVQHLGWSLVLLAI